VADPGIYKMLEVTPQPKFPDRTAIVAKQNADRLAAEEATRQAEADRLAELAARPAPTVYYAPVVAITPVVATGDYLISGSYGYAIPYGNCVNEPGVNNPGNGNPSGWPATSSSPWVGATFLFWGNHTGIVTGLWSNGDVEVRHQNFQGGMHRFPRNMFRGFR
jgi:hypothetical protein